MLNKSNPIGVMDSGIGGLTVVRELHSAEDFEKIGEWLKGDEKYFLQSFTDSDFVLQKGLSAHSRETLRTFADIVRKNVPRVEIRGV